MGPSGRLVPRLKSRDSKVRRRSRYADEDRREMKFYVQGLSKSVIEVVTNLSAFF